MTDLRIKMAALKVKDAGPDDGLQEGEFIAYASVFGNVDSYGDIVEDTFFDRTLEEWKSTGDTIPVLWGHDMYDPFSNIGGVKEATVIKASAEKSETDEMPGLKVHGFLDLENPKAAQVYRLMKGRRTTKMSFAYSVRDGEQKDDGYHLKDGDLYEVSIVQVPANQEAEILAVKHLASSLVKAGRVLSAKNEAALREARDAIDSVLTALDASTDEGGKGAQASGTQPKASEQTPANASVPAEEPATANAGASAEEPKSASSVDVWGAEFDIYSTAYAGKE